MKRSGFFAAIPLLLLASAGALAEEAKPAVRVEPIAASQQPMVSWDSAGNRSVRDSRGGSLISWESNRASAVPNFAAQAAMMNAASMNMHRQFEVEETPLTDGRQPMTRIVPIPPAPAASSVPVTPDYMREGRAYAPDYEEYSRGASPEVPNPPALETEHPQSD